MKKGKFIVFEGGEGSGKTTQISLLKKALADMDIVWTREPGGTKTGQKIREIVLRGETADIHPKTELLLLYSSRAQNMEEIILPALRSGKNVICDRFSLSTRAYQVHGREHLEYLSLCDFLDAEIIGEFAPDMTIFLDISPEYGIARTKGRPDNNRLDDEEMAFHERVHSGYLKELGKIPHTIINADRTAEEVSEEIIALVKKCLGT